MQKGGWGLQQRTPHYPCLYPKQSANCCQVSAATGEDPHILFTSLHIQPFLFKAILNYFGESKHLL